jgi:N-methylhydantoinase B
MSIEIDPITLVVIQNGLNQVCNEMDLAFCRAAFSPVISEAMDRSDGIYHRDDGALIAQGELGLPVFVGTMQFSTRAVIERAKSIEAGDVFIVNDPYLGGTHLMDVRFVKPFFYQGRLFAWLANTGHWPDIGGMVPGGFSAHATGEAVQARRDGRGNSRHHPVEHPHRRPAHRRHQGASRGACNRRETPRRPARPLRRGHRG